MNYPYAMAQHATPFHQMAQQHMPQPMAYNDVRHGQVNPQVRKFYQIRLCFHELVVHKVKIDY